MAYKRSLIIGFILLTTICVISAIIFYLSQGCPAGTFSCDNGAKCIPQRRICDDHKECDDGTDENRVACGQLYGSREMIGRIIHRAIQKNILKNRGGLKNRGQQDGKRIPQNIKEHKSVNGQIKFEQTKNGSNVIDDDDDDDAEDDGQESGDGNHNFMENITKYQQEIYLLHTVEKSKETENGKTNESWLTAHFKNSSLNSSLNLKSNNTKTIKSHNDRILCEISTYPRLCLCRSATVLLCDSNASLTKIPQIGEKITNLIIFNNSLTLYKDDFTNLINLEMLKLKKTNIQQIPPGIFSNLKQLQVLDLRFNRLTFLPNGLFKGLNLLWRLMLDSNDLRYLPFMELAQDLPALEWLTLTDNLLTLQNVQFPRMPSIYEIQLDSNRISYISEETFKQLDHLHLLNLNGNQITFIHPKAFRGLVNIKDIRLDGNPLLHLSGDLFSNNYHLELLSLSNTPLYINELLLKNLNVSLLNLTGIPFMQIEFNAINELASLEYIIYDRFYYCSMTPNIRICKPQSDGVSSLRDLLSKPVLRYSAWIMAFVTIVGNLMVLWGRFIYRDENVAVTMVIRNLALADILMGFYLVTIGLQDYRYRDRYHSVALDWITSWHCAAVGALAVSSSEVSMLILAFMSLERFLLIADPFRGHHRISIRNIFISLLSIWLMGVGIAVAPVVLWHSSTKFYGSYSGTCFPLHIQEAYPLGWEYSAFMFLGVNLFLLVMIAFLYTALLISIWRTRKATPLSLLDCEFAVRFFFIVLTDVLCWAPIIVVKIWVFFNYNISDDIYAWLVVFILPLNSAVNPLLYTFTTPKYRNQILLRGWKKITARRQFRHLEALNGMATTTATATGSSNPDDSSGKGIPMVVTN